ncbi:predicted protein [Naegleria gruberi]|uniref:Predicted protein n=1 Tax=Naegleria gruberi TaxID=5762 RepID=D2V4R9_NAEGR|nr:uncharacterized protein NAEGRDRAFT_63886 [Naegleria gruberi]EFC48150.1 predicted protein [Naegleria gruberi]|eukprot:XP_002680894.1 predicted protein [Naegleria gruberi strain NEG-M]
MHTLVSILFAVVVALSIVCNQPHAVAGVTTPFYPSYNVSTIAGGLNVKGEGYDPLRVSLYSPSAVAIHPITQHVYIAENTLFGSFFNPLSYGAFIRKIANGIVTTYAGTGFASSNYGDGALAINAMLMNPMGISFSANGDLYLTEAEKHRIRKIFTNGTIVTVAGVYGTEGYSADGQLAINSNLRFPFGINVANDGTVYFADSFNCLLRKIGANGIISTIAGVYGFCGYNSDNVIATSSYLSRFRSFAIASNGDFIIADYETHRIRRIFKSNSTIITIAGSGTAGYSGDGGLAINALISYPFSITTTSKGDIFFSSDGECVVRKIDSNGIISTITGNGICPVSPVIGDLGNGGLAKNVQIKPFSLTANYTSGDLYIVDQYNNRVRLVSYSSGIITTIAGHGGSFSGDRGLGINAQLAQPQHAVAANTGEIYIAVTFAGNGTSGFSGDGGLAINAQLNSPRCVAVSGSGEVYIADSMNSRVRKVSTNGIITTIAGNGDKNIVPDGTLAINAPLDVQCIALSPITGEILVLTSANPRLYKITLSGTVYPVAGTGVSGTYGNNVLATSAQLQYTSSLAISSLGDIFISENFRIRKVSADTGIISTVGGSTSSCDEFAIGVPAIGACMHTTSVAVSKNGDFIYYTNEHSIRVIGPDGNINAVGGDDSINGLYGDIGNSTSALFNYLYQTTFIANSGEILISDKGNNRIRRLAPYCPSGYGLNGNFTQCIASCFGVSNELTTCSGHGLCNSPNNCTCFNGFSGLNCQLAICYGKYSNDSNVCSGRGNCSLPNTCSCSNGYTGTECQITACFGKSSASSNVCSGKGACLSSNNCTCNAGYFDSECQSYLCAGVKNTVGNALFGLGCGNGTCVGPNLCSCNLGYVGSNCQYTICNDVASNNSNICSSNGLCISPDICHLQKLTLVSSISKFALAVVIGNTITKRGTNGGVILQFSITNSNIAIWTSISCIAGT